MNSGSKATLCNDMPEACQIVEFSSYAETIPALFETIEAAKTLAGRPRILIKPNLVNTSPFPVTLPAEACGALIAACRRHSDAEILVAEGCGDLHLSTSEVFAHHGYDRMAAELNVELVDLNEAELVELRDPACRVFPTFMMPKIIMESYLVSAAVLKAHSLAGVTLSMKNMIGCAPPAYYQQDGHWKKAAFHRRMQTSIFELNRYRRPDLAFIDASVGMAEHHLRGAICSPPVGRLVAGFDPVAVDASGAELLNISWQRVGHIKMADGVLGRARVPNRRAVAQA